jgi:hypothetical protein
MKLMLPVMTALLLATPALAQETPPEQVTMGLAEFLEMYEKTRDPKEPDEKAPRAYSLASARYAGEVVFEDGEPVTALLTATMAVQVHKEKGWVRAPLLPGGVAVQSAKMDGREAPLVLEGGYYTLVTDKKGTLNVTLEIAAKIDTGAGSSGFAFPLLPAGATEVTVAVPTADAIDFVVSNAKKQSDRVEGGKRIVEASLPPVGSLSVRWQREIPEEEKVDDARVYSEVYTLVGLSDGLMKATATVSHTILFASVDEFKMDVPEGMTVLDVRGSGLRDWTVAEGVLDVDLNYAAEDAYTLTVEMEKVVGNGSVTVTAPLLQPVGSERSKGWVGVEARGNLEISGGEATNASAVDVRTLPAQILGITGQPVLLGYKYLGTDAAVPLIVSQHTDVDVLVTLLDQAEATTMFTVDGRRLTSVRYEVRNNRRQFLKVGLPEGAELWSAAVAGRAVTPASSEGKVLIPLVRSQSSGGALASFAVEVVYVESGSAPDAMGRGTFEAELPKVDVPTTYLAWTVYVPDEAKVPKRSVDGTFREVDYLSRPLGAVDALVVQAEQQAAAEAAMGQSDSGGLHQFEKLLALDERLWVSFDYKGLKR